MGVLILPTLNEKKLPKPSRGEFFGALWQTRGIDITSEPGKIRIAEQPQAALTDGQSSALQIPISFVRSNADTTLRLWAITQTEQISRAGVLYRWDSSAGWSQDNHTNAPTDAVDNVVVFGQASGYDRMVAARDNDLTMLNNGTTWTASWWVATLGQSALALTNPHPIHVFLNLLLVPDGNVLHTIDDALVVTTSRIVLPPEYQIVWIKNDGKFAYLGTRHIRGGEALVFPWNGTSEKYEEPIRVGSRWSLAGIVDKRGSLFQMNEKGQFGEYNGFGFDIVAELPFQGLMDTKWNNVYTDASLGLWNRCLHPNGMAIINGKIQMVLSNSLGDAGSYSPENFHSGIWEYDENVGLYLKHHFSAGENSEQASAHIIPGALFADEVDDLSRTAFYAGAGVARNATPTIRRAIFTNRGIDTSTRGYFVTSKLEPSAFRAFWTRLQLAFRGMEASTDRIVAKYMVDSPRQFIRGQQCFDGAWSGTTGDSFTSTGDLSNVAVGDEIEILYGEGGGCLAHVSAITSGGGTYTVTLDEAVGTVTNAATMRFRVQRWAKLGTISDQAIKQKLFQITKRSTWIRLKIELRGSETSPELEKLYLEFNNSKR